MYVLHVCILHTWERFVKFLLMKRQGLLPYGFISKQNVIQETSWYYYDNNK